MSRMVVKPGRGGNVRSSVILRERSDRRTPIVLYWLSVTSNRSFASLRMTSSNVSCQEKPRDPSIRLDARSRHRHRLIDVRLLAGPPVHAEQAAFRGRGS